jgi:hypothetical protein
MDPPFSSGRTSMYLVQSPGYALYPVLMSCMQFGHKSNTK